MAGSNNPDVTRPPVGCKTLFELWEVLRQSLITMQCLLPAREQELRGLVARLTAADPPMVGIVSGPRAGKSTLINGLLQRRVLPAFSSTASITSAAIHCQRGPSIRVTLKFANLEKWAEMRLSLFTQAFGTGDGNEEVGNHQEKVKKNVKKTLRSLYANLPETLDPTSFTDYWDQNDVLFRPLLGLSISKEFKAEAYEEVLTYVTRYTVCNLIDFQMCTEHLAPNLSPDGHDIPGQAPVPPHLWPWPILDHVIIEAPDFNIPHGIQLVDLPGFGDFNPCRAALVDRATAIGAEMWFVAGPGVTAEHVNSPLANYLERDRVSADSLQLIFTKQDSLSETSLQNVFATFREELELPAQAKPQIIGMNFRDPLMAGKCPAPANEIAAANLEKLRGLLQKRASAWEVELLGIRDELLKWIRLTAPETPTDPHLQQRTALEKILEDFDEQEPHLRANFRRELQDHRRLSQHWHWQSYIHMAGHGWLKRPTSPTLRDFFPNFVHARPLYLRQRLVQIASTALTSFISRIGQEDTGRALNEQFWILFHASVENWASDSFRKTSWPGERWVTTREHIGNLVLSLEQAAFHNLRELLEARINTLLPPPSTPLQMNPGSLRRIEEMLVYPSPLVPRVEPTEELTDGLTTGLATLTIAAPLLPAHVPQQPLTAQVSQDPLIVDASELDGTTLQVHGRQEWMTVTNVPGDGNCFYHVLALQTGVDDVRLFLATDVPAGLPRQIPANLAEVRQNIRTPRLWATETEIDFAACLLAAQIDIYRRTTSGTIQLHASFGHAESTERYRMLHINGNHFMSLAPVAHPPLPTLPNQPPIYGNHPTAPATSTALPNPAFTLNTFPGLPFLPNLPLVNPGNHFNPSFPVLPTPLGSSAPPQPPTTTLKPPTALRTDLAAKTECQDAPEAQDELDEFKPHVPSAALEQRKFLMDHEVLKEAARVKDEVKSSTDPAFQLQRILDFYQSLNVRVETLGLEAPVLEHGIAIASTNVNWATIEIVTVYEAAKTNGIRSRRLGVGKTGDLDHSRSSRLSNICTVDPQRATIIELIKGPCCTLGYNYTTHQMLEMTAITIAQLMVLPRLKLVRVCSGLAFGALCMDHTIKCGQVAPWKLREDVLFWGTSHPTHPQLTNTLIVSHYTALAGVISCPCKMLPQRECQHWTQFSSQTPIPNVYGPSHLPGTKKQRTGTPASIGTWKPAPGFPAVLTAQKARNGTRQPRKKQQAAVPSAAPSAAPSTPAMAPSPSPLSSPLPSSAPVEEPLQGRKPYPGRNQRHPRWTPQFTFWNKHKYTLVEIKEEFIRQAGQAIALQPTDVTASQVSEEEVRIHLASRGRRAFYRYFLAATACEDFHPVLPIAHRLAKDGHFDLLLQYLEGNPTFDPCVVSVFGHHLYSFLEHEPYVLELVMRLFKHL